jgi:hypothetical protein
LRGRPRGRTVVLCPNVVTWCRTQASPPNGRPRRVHRRTAASSASVCGWFSQSSQLPGHGNGGSQSAGRRSLTPPCRCHQLPHGQASAWATIPARKAFRSTERHNTRKWSSTSTGNDLNRPWYKCPEPSVPLRACCRCVCVNVNQLTTGTTPGPDPATRPNANGWASDSNKVPASAARPGFANNLQEGGVILRPIQERAAPVGAVQHVIDQATRRNAPGSSPAAMVVSSRAPRQGKNGRTWCSSSWRLLKKRLRSQRVGLTVGLP